jgi:hypothetical protein
MTKDTTNDERDQGIVANTEVPPISLSQPFPTDAPVMTEGTWELSDVREFGPRKVIAWQRNPNGHRWRKTIAVISEGNLDEGEADANARAITAIPEMRGLIAQAVRVLIEHAPPDGLTDHEAMTRFYGIFDGPDYRAYIAKAEHRS